METSPKISSNERVNLNDKETFCQLNVRIPKVLKEYLRALSKRTGCSMEVYAQAILLKHFEERIEEE